MPKAVFFLATLHRPHLLRHTLKRLVDQRDIPGGWQVEILVAGSSDDPGRGIAEASPRTRYVEMPPTCQHQADRFNRLLEITDAQLVMAADDDDLQPFNRARAAIQAFDGGAAWSCVGTCIFYDVANDRLTRWVGRSETGLIGTAASYSTALLRQVGGWPKTPKGKDGRIARKIHAHGAKFKDLTPELSDQLVCLQHTKNVWQRPVVPKGATTRRGEHTISGLGSLAQYERRLEPETVDVLGMLHAEATGTPHPPKRAQVTATVPTPSPVTIPSTGKPRFLLLADVPGWAFDQNLRDMALYLPDFEFDFWYVSDGRPFPDPERYDGIYIPYHRWAQVNRVLPYDKAFGSLRSFYFTPEKPGPPTSADIALVQKHRVYHTVTRANYEDLRSTCPNVYYLTNPVNMRRFPAPTPVTGAVVPMWNGNAHHSAPRGATPDPKGFFSIVQPACKMAGMGLEYAEFHTKRLTPSEMPAFYARGNLTLCAAAYDGASNSILEAMAAGHAVISTRVGNMMELDASMRQNFGDSGILFAERTVAAFAQALRELRSDPRRVTRMGELNRQEIQSRWSWDVWAAEYRRFFREGLSRPKSAVPLKASRAVVPHPKTDINGNTPLSVCSLNCDEPTLQDSQMFLKRSLNQQFHFYEVKHHYPMHEAFNAMLDHAPSKWVIQLDADMMLYEGAIDCFYERANYFHDVNWFLIYCLLWDPFEQQTRQAIKMFNLDVIGSDRFHNVRGTDRDFTQRMEAKGRKAILGFSYPIADHIMKGPTVLFSHYLDVFHKDLVSSPRPLVEQKAVQTIQKFARLLGETQNMDYWFAILGILYGFCNTALGDLEKDYRFEVKSSPVADFVDLFKAPSDVQPYLTGAWETKFKTVTGTPCPNVGDLISRLRRLRA